MNTDDSDSPGPTQEAPSRPLPLEYQHATTGRPTDWSTQCAGAAIVTALLILMGVFVALFVSFTLTYGTQGKNDRAVTIGLATVGILAFVAFNLLAVWSVRNPRLRGYAWGIWIGMGVALLIEGACFGRLR